MRSKTTGELIEELERERDEIKERLVKAERTIDVLRRQLVRKREETSKWPDRVNRMCP